MTNAVIGPWIKLMRNLDRRPAEPLLLLSRVGQYDCPRKSEAASESEWACEPHVHSGAKEDPPLMARNGSNSDLSACEIWRELTRMRHWLRGIALKARLASSRRASNGRTRVPQWPGNRREEDHHRRSDRVSSRRRGGARFMVFTARNVGKPTSGCSCSTGNPCGIGSARSSSNSGDSGCSCSQSLRRRQQVPRTSNAPNAPNSSGSPGARISGSTGSLNSTWKLRQIDRLM